MDINRNMDSYSKVYDDNQIAYQYEEYICRGSSRDNREACNQEKEGGESE